MRGTVRIAVLAALAVLPATGCAYYNTLYNAKQKYDEAQEQKQAADPDRTQISKSEERLYTESFEKAARVVKYYPNSKWVDDALLLMGKASFEKGDYSTALRKFDEILTFYPKSNLKSDALVMKGRTLAATKDYASAVSALDAASKIDRKEHRDEVQYFLGVVAEGQDQTEEAESHYGEVVRRYRDSEWFSAAGIRAGDIATERGDLAAAVDFYERVRKDGRTPEERFRGGMKKGEALVAMGEYERARRTFDDVAKATLDPKDRGQARVAYARATLSSGQDEEAIAEFHQVIQDFERQPAAADAQLEIARWYDESGKLEEALTEYEKVKDQGTGNEAWQEASARRTEIQRVLDLQTAIADEKGRDDEFRDRFLLAEQLLEKIGDVDGALQEYASLATDADGTEWGARALFAQAWVLKHRRDDPAAADSLMFRLANHYAGTDVDAFARRKLGYPVWKVEVLDPPLVQYVQGSGEKKDYVIDRVEPKVDKIILPPGVSEVQVWVRVQVAEDGTAASVQVKKSAGVGMASLDRAAEEAAKASRYLAPSSGGPAYQVMQYTFPPPVSVPAGADDEPSAADRDAMLNARDAAAAAAKAAADSAAAAKAAPAATDSTANVSPLPASRGPVVRDQGGSGGSDD